MGGDVSSDCSYWKAGRVSIEHVSVVQSENDKSENELGCQDMGGHYKHSACRSAWIFIIADWMSVYRFMGLT